ncbi:SAM-dependent methyltransferase [Brachybacterium endophyticum]|uniref:SAM-dependent methyltransferase n=1 Tax=Brachybacterium endophyticum TaxID=2182385 RepID=A0A2U2RKQ9_9MICO|nr:class I SAM-dependent methyltransferase [Brachybacterium endophyticum]PWH06364.1 SAM-dependent methyltransferase [Brachybacterium endophyticum]
MPDPAASSPGAIPPVSSRDTPRFRSVDQQRALAAAFQGQGADYDRLRPGYPAPVIDGLVEQLPDGARDVVDLGAGTGKLSVELVARGLGVTAVDPSSSMLDAARAAAEGTATSSSGSFHTRVASAEDTGLPDDSADLVTVAQAWHWFDTEAACHEIARILRPGGLLALIWNSLDVQIPWVHRYSRIMHAGDVYRDDFTPPLGGLFHQRERVVHRWEDPRTTQELIDLARTRSYVITAAPERREKVLSNLDWYLHEHLEHERGSIVPLPYRTDLFVAATAPNVEAPEPSGPEA